jgi:hypothetical protein
MSIYEIGMMTAVEFWECRSSLGIYLHLLWFGEQIFGFFDYNHFSAVEKICTELAMRSARPLRRPLNSPIWHPKGPFDMELFKTSVLRGTDLLDLGFRLPPFQPTLPHFTFFLARLKTFTLTLTPANSTLSATISNTSNHWGYVVWNFTCLPAQVDHVLRLFRADE